MDELKYIVWLAHMYGTPSQYIDSLLGKFGGAAGVYNATGKALHDAGILPSGMVSKIIELKQKVDPEKVFLDMNSKGIRYIPKFSDDYPPLLKTIANPPLGLFVLGEMPDFDRLWIGIIGTRRPSAYGRAATRKISEELSQRDVVIVSGMADGLDGEAAQAAIDSGGTTVAVLGSGVDICYPRIHERLYESIQQNGCLISEFPPGINSDKWHFPLRNRIISGLSQAIVVTEAPVRSGTSITINYALEQGREVLAVPGNITNPKSEGTNMLIKDGAHVATCGMDVLDVLGVIENAPLNNLNEEIHNNVHIPLAPNEKTVYALLEDEPAELDDIIKKSGLEPRSVMIALTKLGLAGLISELPGQKYKR